VPISQRTKPFFKTPRPASAAAPPPVAAGALARLDPDTVVPCPACGEADPGCGFCRGQEVTAAEARGWLRDAGALDHEAG
jgi:hypothetical protein